MLKKIVNDKRDELEVTKRRVSISDLTPQARDQPECRAFAKSLISDKGRPARIIAEVKKASPSKGIIREDFDPVAISRIYEEAGASAISCLTESNYFLGDLSFLAQIKDAISLPILRKDFIIDEYQVTESRACGADAFLLIAAILDTNQLKEYVHMGVEWGMEPLVEVHCEEELEDAVKSDATVIGINNRDLKTFKTDISVTERLVNKIPKERIRVSESGIRCREDITKLESCGVNAFLIGETFMKEKSIGKKLKELLGC